MKTVQLITVRPQKAFHKRDRFDTINCIYVPYENIYSIHKSLNFITSHEIRVPVPSDTSTIGEELTLRNAPIIGQKGKS